MQEADNKYLQYIRKKFSTQINWDMCAWESIILILVLNRM